MKKCGHSEVCGQSTSIRTAGIKWALLVLLITLMGMLLCSCGKSEAAINADNLILEIGEVSLASGEKITVAEEAVNSLKQSEFKQLEQFSVLEEARNAYDRLVEEKTVADNAAIAKIEAAIDAIGTVTPGREPFIQGARYQYDHANNEVKAGITNYAVLEKAERQLSDLKVQNVMDLIDQIGTIELDSEEKINLAKTAYNDLTVDEKERVKNYGAMEEAEEQLSDLRVQNVINLIDQIGQVELGSGEKILLAKSAYSALTSEEKELVTNYANIGTALKQLMKLENAEKERLAEKEKEERKRAFQEAVASLRIQRDKVEGVTWYKPSTYPYYADSRSYVLPYIGQRGSNTWLRLAFHYTGNDWLFFEKIIITVDGKKFTKTYDYFDVERDNGGRRVWEWVDISPSNSDIEMLKKIVDSKETIVRFKGDNYHYDFTIGRADKTAINQVLIAYEGFKNK